MLILQRDSKVANSQVQTWLPPGAPQVFPHGAPRPLGLK